MSEDTGSSRTRRRRIGAKKKSTTTRRTSVHPAAPVRVPEMFGLSDLMDAAKAGDKAAADRLELYYRLANFAHAIRWNLPADHDLISFFSGTLGGEETVPSMERLEELRSRFRKMDAKSKTDALGGWKSD